MGALEYEEITPRLPRRTAVNRLNRLREAGWVERLGEALATVYHLNEEGRAKLTEAVNHAISREGGEASSCWNLPARPTLIDGPSSTFMRFLRLTCLEIPPQKGRCDWSP